MTFFEKLNQGAKNIGDKTGDVIETTKLNARINSEKAAAAEDLQKIGEYYYLQFTASGQASHDVMEFCQSAKAHYDAAELYQTEINRIKSASSPQQKTSADTCIGIICPSCGASNGAGTRFCSECGQRMED